MICQHCRRALWCIAFALFLSKSALAVAPTTSSTVEHSPVVRFAQIAKITPSRAEEFKKLVASLPAEVAEAFDRHGLRSELIYIKELSDNEPWAFRYQEYHGRHLADDLAALAADSSVMKWRRTVDACLAGPWTDVAEVFHTDGRSNRPVDASAVERFGQVVGIRPEMIPPYKLLHEHAWPEVLAKITEGNIRNYSIYLGNDGNKSYLFANFEYVGSDFAGDMQSVDGDAATQAWMKFTDQACQLPIPTRGEGEWWADMQEVLSWRVDGDDDD